MVDERNSHTKPVQQKPGGTDIPGSVPRLPHERDESSDSQQSEPRAVIRQAHDDLESGRVDTDRGAPAHDAYQKQKGGDAPRR